MNESENSSPEQSYIKYKTIQSSNEKISNFDQNSIIHDIKKKNLVFYENLDLLNDNDIHMSKIESDFGNEPI